MALCTRKVQFNDYIHEQVSTAQLGSFKLFCFYNFFFLTRLTFIPSRPPLTYFHISYEVWRKLCVFYNSCIYTLIKQCWNNNKIRSSRKFSVRCSRLSNVLNTDKLIITMLLCCFELAVYSNSSGVSVETKNFFRFCYATFH